MNLCRFLCIPLSLGLLACASNEPKPPVTSESFTTMIQADGTKQFNYTLVMEMSERSGRPPRDGKGDRGMRGGVGDHPDGSPGGQESDSMLWHEGEDNTLDGLEHLTEEGLLAKIEDTGYCRNSYHQLETQSRRGAMNIVGACYDKASDEDRSKFPNPAPKKIIEERLD